MYLRIIAICVMLISSGCVANMKSGLVGYMALYNTEIVINDANSQHDAISAEIYSKLNYYVIADKERSNYRLEIEYDTDEKKYAIQSNSIATRQKTSLAVSYKYIDLSTNTIISEAKITRSGSYYIQDSTYSTYVALEDELKNLTLAVVEEILTQISIDHNRLYAPRCTEPKTLAHQLTIS